MSAEWREIAFLPDGSAKRARGLAAIGRELPFDEAYARACGDDELADALGRFAVSVSYCARRMGREEASDVAADVFAVAWQRLDAVPGGEESLP